jgi:hypothetical protein
MLSALLPCGCWPWCWPIRTTADLRKQEPPSGEILPGVFVCDSSAATKNARIVPLTLERMSFLWPTGVVSLAAPPRCNMVKPQQPRGKRLRRLPRSTTREAKRREAARVQGLPAQRIATPGDRRSGGRTGRLGRPRTGAAGAVVSLPRMHMGRIATVSSGGASRAWRSRSRSPPCCSSRRVSTV